MSAKEKVRREKLILDPFTEELLSIDSPIQVNGKAGRTREKAAFCAFT